jgi:hypothetical protein
MAAKNRRQNPLKMSMEVMSTETRIAEEVKKAKERIVDLQTIAKPAMRVTRFENEKKTAIMKEKERNALEESHDRAKEQDQLIRNLSPAHHKRILRFINDAGSPFDLMNSPIRPMSAEQMADMQPGETGMQKQIELMDAKSAHAIFDLREREFPLGFTNIHQLTKIANTNILGLIEWLSDLMFGRWQTLPYIIPRQGGGSVSIVHAALLHTGKVLFLDDGPTPIWDPNDEVNPQFEFPVNNPDYSLTCSGHSFLSNGNLLVVGGGGFGPRAGANKGFKFDPVAKTWTKTSGDMSKVRWYPTAVTTGDNRMLVVGGWNENAILQNDIEVYNEASDSFVPIGGATLGFPTSIPVCTFFRTTYFFIRGRAGGMLVEHHRPRWIALRIFNLAGPLSEFGHRSRPLPPIAAKECQ